MTDEERRRFELKRRAAAGEMPAEDAAEELDMGDPRDARGVEAERKSRRRQETDE